MMRRLSIVIGISIADGSMDEVGIKEWINQHKNC